jgi:hypothetical protein
MLQRSCPIATLYCGTSAAASLVGTTGAAGKVDFRNFSGGQVYVPAGSSITSLTWYGSHDGVTFLPVQDGAGNAVVSTVAAGYSCLIPASCFACAFLLAVGNAAGTINLSIKT